MAHSLTPVPTPAAPISTRSTKKTHFSSLGFQRVLACHQGCGGDDLEYKLVQRRFVYVFSSVLCSSAFSLLLTSVNALVA